MTSKTTLTAKLGWHDVPNLQLCLLTECKHRLHIIAASESASELHVVAEKKYKKVCQDWKAAIN